MLALSLVNQLKVLQESLDAYRARIEELYAEHEHAAIFDSLPGVSKTLGPRLLAHFGSDPNRYDSAEAIMQLAGVAPVTSTSGVRHRPTVSFRRSCRTDFRTTMHIMTWCSIMTCPWAHAFYYRAREHGQSHPLALRNLGIKWLKIIYRMWRNKEPYNEAVYLNALIRSGSPLIDYMNTSRPHQPSLRVPGRNPSLPHKPDEHPCLKPPEEPSPPVARKINTARVSRMGQGSAKPHERSELGLDASGARATSPVTTGGSP